MNSIFYGGNQCRKQDGSPETRRSRNIAANPAVVVHLESGDQVLIVEGDAYAAGKPEPELAKRLAQAYAAKYAASGYEPKPGSWDQGGLYVVHPQTVFAWTKFPSDSTSWQFNPQICGFLSYFISLFSLSER